jgi:hypothetical protein
MPAKGAPPHPQVGVGVLRTKGRVAFGGLFAPPPYQRSG